MSNRIIESGLIFLLIFTPLALGTVHTWSITIMELTVLFLFLVWMFKWTFEGREKTVTDDSTISDSFSGFRLKGNVLFIPLVLFLVLIILQLIPLPPKVLKILSPETYKIYAEYLPYEWPAQNAKWRTISIYTYATNTEFYKILIYGLVFFLIINTITTKKQINSLIKTIIFMGFFLAFFGVIQKLSWNGGIYWFWESTQRASPFGPYVNRNHFAGYMVMAIPLTLGFLVFKLHHFSYKTSHSSFLKRLAENEKLITNIIILLFLILIMISALFLSLSRGGMISFFISMFFFVFGLIFIKRERKKLWIVLMIFLLLIISLDWFGMEPIAKRLGTLQKLYNQESYETRIEIWQDTSKIIKDFPILGTGFNTFSYIFPNYKTFDKQLSYKYTENDYLQLLSETGVIGLAIALSFLSIFFIKTLKKWYKRHDIYVRTLVLGGFVSCVALLSHSFTDFNLRIPANALLFTVILGLTYNLVHVENKKKKEV